MDGDLLVSGVVQATPDKLRSSYSFMKYHKEGSACGRIPYDPASSEADCEYPLDQNQASHLFQLRRPALAFVPAGNRKESGGPDQLPALQLSA